MPANQVIQSFFIDGIPPLPNRTRGQHWSKTYKEKAEWESLIGWTIKASKVRPTSGKVLVKFTVQVGSNRTIDPDNLAWACSKPTMDALQKMGIIENDDIDSVELSYAFNRKAPKGYLVELSEI